ncbi:NAD(P)H-dependent oxidoreductase [Paenibacillus sp. NPDC058071]|uniref:NAD(P)H-dependent oxidoreductase n=1 Tax=Paenibacillus sp. NPDC058071 TaxID=3346326 RepID=UPI0036DA6CA2
MQSNKKIVVIDGHPDLQSYCASLSEAYAAGAVTAGSEVRIIRLRDLQFNPILQYGYRKRTELESDLLNAQELIRWADHLVFVYPIWWGAMPALLKGFIDRVFLPGFGFKYRENSIIWDKLLKGKTARLIVTSDTPSFYNRIVYGRAGYNIMKKNILQFCGISPVRITEIGPVKSSVPEQRDKWLARVKKLGTRLG